MISKTTQTTKEFNLQTSITIITAYKLATKIPITTEKQSMNKDTIDIEPTETSKTTDL